MTGRSDSPSGGETPSPDELRVQVEGTRERLGQTVEALAAKADAKAIAQEKAAQAKQMAGRNPVAIAAAVVGVVAVTVTVAAAVSHRRRCGR